MRPMSESQLAKRRGRPKAQQEPKRYVSSSLSDEAAQIIRERLTDQRRLQQWGEWETPPEMPDTSIEGILDYQAGPITDDYQVHDIFSSLYYIGRGGPLSSAIAHGDMANLTRRLDQLSEGIKHLGATEAEHFQHVISRLEKLEAMSDGTALVTEVESERDPYLKWCRDNLEKLRDIEKSIGPAFVGVDVIGNNIVVIEKDEETFVHKLQELDEAQRSKLYRIHTSMFV